MKSTVPALAVRNSSLFPKVKQEVFNCLNGLWTKTSKFCLRWDWKDLGQRSLEEGKPSQSHPVHFLQRQNSSLCCFERYLLEAAHCFLQDTNLQIVLSRLHLCFPFPGGGILLPSCLFLPYFFPFLVAFPHQHFFSPALCCCGLNNAHISSLSHLHELGIVKQGCSFTS